MSYDKAYSDDVMARLTGYDLNPSEQINKLPSSVKENFYNEFAETLLSQEYDSDTVIKESLDNTAKEYFKPINYQTKRAIERDFNNMGFYKTMEIWQERINNGDYKTIDENILYEYINTLQVMDDINFY